MSLSIASETARNLVAKSCSLLDMCQFEAFLGICSDDFKYSIKVYSPEIRKEMVWLQHDLNGLITLFSDLPDHLQRSGKLLRTISYPIIEVFDSQINSVTSFSLLHTNINGKTEILCAGYYHDKILDQCGGFYLNERVVRLDTRDLGIGLHVPI